VMVGSVLELERGGRGETRITRISTDGEEQELTEITEREGKGQNHGGQNHGGLHGQNTLF